MTRLDPRATLLLGHECDNACVFCAQAGVGLEPIPTADLRARLIELRGQNEDEISFVGGEPSLDPRLPELIEFARELGFRAIGLQTNGRRLASDPGLLARLVAAGLGDLQLSIHGPTAEVHDYHTDQPGSFAALLDLIALGHRIGLTLVATTIVTRSNFRELGKLPAVLKRRGIAGWLVESVGVHGAAVDNFARVVPRIGMALPWALLALEQARRNALPAWIRGAPLCGLGPFAAVALPEPRREQPEPCTSCPARDRCPGLDRAYIELFGTNELSARAARPLADLDEPRARLVRMFVGPGTRMARSPQLRSIAEPPPKPRRLPVVADRPHSDKPES